VLHVRRREFITLLGGARPDAAQRARTNSPDACGGYRMSAFSTTPRPRTRSSTSSAEIRHCGRVEDKTLSILIARPTDN